MEISNEIEREGPVWYEWRAWRIHLPHDGVGEQWLLVQRQPDHPDDHGCYVSNTPPETRQGELAGAALTRHSIEELLAKAKSETGLADYQVRHWQGWYRHITLALLAHIFLKLIPHEQREKSSLPVWLSLSVSELRTMINLVFPLQVLSRAFRLHWFRWRREHRFRAVASRFRVDPKRLFQSALPP